MASNSEILSKINELSAKINSLVDQRIFDSKINILNSDISTLQQENQTLKKEIENLNNYIYELKCNIDDANQKTQSFQHEMQQLNQQIAELLDSTSWKLTKPLRKSKELCRKIIFLPVYFVKKIKLFFGELISIALFIIYLLAYKLYKFAVKKYRGKLHHSFYMAKKRNILLGLSYNLSKKAFNLLKRSLIRFNSPPIVIVRFVKFLKTRFPRLYRLLRKAFKEISLNNLSKFLEIETISKAESILSIQLIETAELVEYFHSKLNK